MVCRAVGLELHHVKLHGAFYMMALDDAKLARAVAEAVALFDDRLLVYTLAGSEMWGAAKAKGLRPVPEFFLDRPLRRDGTVVMFNWWEQFEATPEVVAARAVSVATTGQVVSLEGEPVSVSAETFCVRARSSWGDDQRALTAGRPDSARRDDSDAGEWDAVIRPGDRLPAPAAHLPGARHRRSDPGRTAAEGVEACRCAREWAGCLERPEGDLGLQQLTRSCSERLVSGPHNWF